MVAENAPNRRFRRFSARIRENQIRATTKMRRTTGIRRSRMSERTSRSSAGPRLDAEFQEIAQRPPRTDGLALQDRFVTG